MMSGKRGDISLVLMIVIIIIAGFFLSGGLFSYKFTNPDTNGAFVPLSPTPQNPNEALHLGGFPFLFLTPTPTPQPPGSPGGPIAQCNNQGVNTNDIGSIVSTMSKSFGLHLIGSDVTLTRANITYTTVCLLFKSQTFSHLLNSLGSPFTIDLEGGGCAGHANAASGIVMYGSCGNIVDRFLISHELGHMVAFRNPNLYNQYLSTVWPATLPTWNCQLDYGPGPWPGECWADMIGEYLTYPLFRDAVGGAPPGPPTLSNFPTTYHSYYQFAHDKIFGGVTYF